MYSAKDAEQHWKPRSRRKFYTSMNMRSDAYTKTLHHHTVKLDLWKVTPALVLLIINREESTRVISQSARGGNGVICCGGGP